MGGVRRPRSVPRRGPLTPRFATNDGRVANQDDLDREIAAFTAGRDCHELMHLLQAAGVRAGAVQNAEDVNEHDPQMAHRDVFFELDHPVIGEARFEGVPFTATQFAPDHWRSAPLLGEDNDYVYGTILGSERGRDRRPDRARSDLSGRLTRPPQRPTAASRSSSCPTIPAVR